jgi:hypothetical protein
LTSFLDGVRTVRTIEDQILAETLRCFPAQAILDAPYLALVFSLGSRKLEVFNVNRARIETSLGVDLLYWNEPFDAWTLLQYKSMESGGTPPRPFYRPDGTFSTELARMQAFRTAFLGSTETCR